MREYNMAQLSPLSLPAVSKAVETGFADNTTPSVPCYRDHLQNWKDIVQQDLGDENIYICRR